VLAAGLFGDWPKRIEWVGIAIGFLGVALLMSDGNLQAAPIGVMAQSIGLAFWAVGTAVSRHVELPSGGMGNAAEMLMGGAILMVMSVIRGERIVGPIAPQAAVAWVYLVTIGSLLAFSAYMHVVKNVRPAMASSYAYINPVVAIALGALIANEQTTPVALIAVGVIIVGVAFMSLVRGRAS
jgi:drug/metabolite transporter (DMT)-like permease